MRALFVHPGPLMYTKVFLRLEPLGLELAAAAAERAGVEARLLDLQVEPEWAFFRALERFQPDLLAFSLNYLANVPEVLALASAAKARLPRLVVAVGGHSASFIAETLLAQSEGAIDVVLRGEGETAIPELIAALGAGRALSSVPGAVTAAGKGPPPRLVADLDALLPARHLLRHPRKYFIGLLDPAASIEFTRGCPWDCAFCSAWTFYGRSYRRRQAEAIAEELARIAAEGIFIVDDVAFIHPEDGMAIADAIERRGLRKRYYLETRADVLLRHPEVFRRWQRLGLAMMFMGLEAIDEEGLKLYRKRVSLSRNFEALALARQLGITVAINLIVDPSWDRERFAAVRAFCEEIPEVVNLTVNTPYPGTETWAELATALTSRDYRLFDIQHAVLPTRLPLADFYDELTRTQAVLNRKHLGLRTVLGAAGAFARLALRGQTNFLRAMFNFRKIYSREALLADHAREVRYEVPLPPSDPPPREALYVHPPGRAGREMAAGSG